MHISLYKNTVAIQAFVIDADEIVRTSLCDVLGAYGFTPRAFVTAADFIAAQPEIEGTCLVLDPSLPPRTVLESYTCEDGLILSAPIVVVAAQDDPVRRQRTLRNGVVSHLTKPIDSRTFLAALRGGSPSPSGRPPRGP